MDALERYRDYLHLLARLQLERKEQALRLALALAALPETQREALVLQHWQGWSLAAIAEHMQRTPAAVAGLLKRGLAQLRTMLHETA